MKVINKHQLQLLNIDKFNFVYPCECRGGVGWFQPSQKWLCENWTCSYGGDTSVQNQALLFCFITKLLHESQWRRLSRIRWHTHEVSICWLLRCRLNYTCFINCPQDVLSPITNTLTFESIISYKEKNKWLTRIVLNRVSWAATFEV